MWTFEGPRREFCCHRLGSGPGRHPRPVIMRTITSFMSAARLNLTQGPGLGIPKQPIWKLRCSKYWLLFPQSAINNGLPRPDIEAFSLQPMVEYPLCIFISNKWSRYFSCHTLEGISKMQTRMEDYAQWIKVDERFIHGNLWLLAKVVYNLLMS